VCSKYMYSLAYILAFGSALQCVAVRCSVLQCVAEHCNVV